MFTRDGIRELHGWTHESLDILLRHIASVPGERLREPLAGFGIATVWKQLAHIVEGEEVWVCDLQGKARLGWGEKDCANMEVLLAEKERIRLATRAYLNGLSDAELNRTLTERPRGWVGELKSPAFILLHVVRMRFIIRGRWWRCCGRWGIRRRIRICREAEALKEIVRAKRNADVRGIQVAGGS
jgi:uncharacterized damage-inducible protein DinB